MRDRWTYQGLGFSIMVIHDAYALPYNYSAGIVYMIRLDSDINEFLQMSTYCTSHQITA